MKERKHFTGAGEAGENRDAQKEKERVDTVCYCSAAEEDLAMKKHGLLYNDR